MYRSVTDLILASASPRRQELLESVGLHFKVVVADADEDMLNGEHPAHMVKRLASKKAALVAKRYPKAWVIGADTDVVLDGKVFGKPASVEEACNMLLQLQGRSHEVWGGFSVMNLEQGIERVESECTYVSMAELDEDKVRAYAMTGEPMGKAGAYAVQGIGAAFIKGIKGSYTNVVGLSLSSILEVLLEVGAVR